MKVELFVPCHLDQFYPQTAMNAYKLLRKAGVDVEYNPNQTCCGRMAYNLGFTDDAIYLGDKFIDAITKNDYIVVPSSACVAHVVTKCDKLFFNTPNHHNYKEVRKNIRELSDFLVNVLHYDNFNASFPHKITYHDCCSAKGLLGISSQPRQLLSKVDGLELVEMRQSDMCCGSDHSLMLYNEPVSSAMANRKIKNALNTGAEYIVSTDMTCLSHIGLYAEKQNIPIKVIHIADVLASGWQK